MVKTKNILMVTILICLVCVIFPISVMAADTYYINSNFSVGSADLGKWMDWATPANSTYILEGDNRVVQTINNATAVSAERGQFVFNSITGNFNGTTFVNGPTIAAIDVKIDGAAKASREFFGNLFTIYYKDTEAKYYLSLMATTGAKDIMEITKGQWYTIKVAFDTTTNSYLGVYVNDVLRTKYVDGTNIGTVAMTGLVSYATTSNAVRMWQKQFSTFAGTAILYMDNVKLYKTSVASVSNFMPPQNSEIDLNEKVEITFSNDMDTSTFTPDKLQIINTLTSLPISYSNAIYDYGTKKVTIPVKDMAVENGQTYNVVITTGVKDIFGQSTSATTVTSFKVASNAVTIVSANFSKGNLGARTEITQIDSSLIWGGIEVQSNVTTTKEISLISILYEKTNGINNLKNIYVSGVYLLPKSNAKLSSAIKVPQIVGAEEYMIDLYTWDSLNGLRPYGKKWTIDAAGIR